LNPATRPQGRVAVFLPTPGRGGLRKKGIACVSAASAWARSVNRCPEACCGLPVIQNVIQTLAKKQVMPILGLTLPVVCARSLQAGKVS
jgi:hypothetical protein